MLERIVAALRARADIQGWSARLVRSREIQLYALPDAVEARRVIASERYVSPYGIAEIYAALNDKEQTYKWLETAYRDRAVWMSYLAVDPVFDSIRSEEHFRDLLRRVGLSP